MGQGLLMALLYSRVKLRTLSLFPCHGSEKASQEVAGACLLLTDRSVREQAGQDGGSLLQCSRYVRGLHQILELEGQACLRSV